MPARTPKRALWQCPACGAKLVTKNMWHACGAWTVEAFLATRGPRARTFFDRFVGLVDRCGPFEFAPAKTRVAVMVRVRFAAVTALSDRGITITFGLHRPLKNRRIHKVEQFGRWFNHTMRITDPKELDGEVLGWLREAYRVGQQIDLP
jgi:hypothetical protein